MAEQTPFVVDYNLARRCYPCGEFYAKTLDANRIRPAFLVTNEYLNRTIGAFGGVARDVLTVAASGDQPLLYAAHGARHVDTFDVTFCARAIMDLKTTAISMLDYDRYIKMISDLLYVQRTRQNILIPDNVARVVSEMPGTTREFILRMSGANIFASGLYRSSEKYSFQPTATQYQQMQNKVRWPFNFIWTDIVDLHMYLDSKYDVINISNIFEWIPAANVMPVLRNLFEYVRPGGYILATVFSTYNDYVENAFDSVVAIMGRDARVDYATTMREHVIMLRRLR